MRLMPWVILWRGGLGALDLAVLVMLLAVVVVVVVLLLLRVVVGGKVEVVILYHGITEDDLCDDYGMPQME